MTSGPAFRLVFRLRPPMGLRAKPGPHCPCLHGCRVIVDADRRVEIEAPSRERLFEQAARFLGTLGRTPAQQLPALVVTSPDPGRGLPGGRDSWSIIVGARVAFAPTAIEPTLFDADELTALAAG